MEESRLEFHEILKEVLGTSNVYYQPPESLKLSYPAIVYELNSLETRHGDGRVYLFRKSYTVTLIDFDQDTETALKLLNLKYSRFERMYVSDNLYHFVFKIYY